MQRNIRLVLEYDGTDFRGWQVQPGQRTVQGELETVLRRLFGGPIRVTAAGRTDAGVHARGQVANFAADSALDLTTIKRAVDALLPDDVSVRSVDCVPPEFNARRDAQRREYAYHVAFERRALGRRYAVWVRGKLDLGAMQRGADSLIGLHDFSSFCVAANEKENRCCRVLECVWERADGGMRLKIAADRFLRAMVRGIAGTLLQVGRGTRDAGDIPGILEARNRACAGPTAPAHGLFLERVVYKDPPAE
ncbi:MAG: tRNA pseudouridine(38-40) synthase TruA [Candidatus Latescibacteria bacterium]|jgi:tRNA pseudouridine38-40 synthase|nr:tRNA pseudouridine(38-40) synthase TruA [Candidatus Latescibacterota bacterium]